MSFLFLKKMSLCAMAVTLPLASVMAANVPAGYSVYSYEELKIGNSAGMNGGFIGGKSTVLIGNDAKVTGSVIAKGALTMYDRSRVDGDVKSGSTVRLINGATIGGSKVENTAIPTYTIPTRSITTGTTNKTINDRQSGIAAPGNYNTVTIGNASTVTLSSGVYNINTLTIYPDAVLKLDFPDTGSITINVKSNFTYSDRVKMQFVNCTNGSLVSVYYNGTTPVDIGNNSVAYGAFSAPNAKVTVCDRAAFNGTLFAKRVELRPGLFAESMVDQWLKVDSDGDGVPDYVENSCGTNSGSGSDKPTVLNTGTYANKTAIGSQKVTMRVSHVAEYSHCADFPVTFGKNSVKGDLIPVNNIIATNDYRAPLDSLPLQTGYTLDGNKYHAVTGEVTSGEKILFAFPISDADLGVIKDFTKLSHFNEQTNVWEDVEIAYVTGNAVYAYVNSFSVYAVSTNWNNVYKVDLTGGTGIYSTIGAAFTAITVDQAIAGNENKNYVVCVAQGVYRESVTMPFRTSIIGGFQSLTSTLPDLNTIIATAPKKYRTIMDGLNADNSRAVTGSLIKFNQIATTLNINVIIDGVEFHNASSNMYTDIGALMMSADQIGGHYVYLDIRNCVFENNSGERCGALFLLNISNVNVESCVFSSNVSTSEIIIGSASAILIDQYQDCGVSANIHSCVFFGNNSAGTTAAYPTGTICNSRDVGDLYRNDRPVNVYDCTFHSNTTAHPNGGSVIHRQYDAMPMSITNCIVNDASINPIYPSALSNTSLEFGTTHFQGAFTGTLTSDVTAACGADGIWGTGDDGLRLKYTSPCRMAVENTSTTLHSARDVAGRLRKVGTISDKQDKGAYETYIRVLSIGSDNTVGQDAGFNYQAQLKTVARSSGYMIDFVGTATSAATYSSECLIALGEDPSNPNTVITTVGSTSYTTGFYDLDMTAQRYDVDAANGGLISNISTQQTILKNLDFDFALVNVGDNDIITGNTAANTYSSFVSFVNGIIDVTKTHRKILVSTAIDQKTPNTEIQSFNNAISTNVDFEGITKPVIYKLNASTKNDMNETVDGIVMSSNIDDINRINHANGFLLMAKIWWRTISAVLPTL